MNKAKAGTNIFAIIFKSFVIYVKNFIPLTKVTLFPVFGQLLGLILIFYPTYLYKVYFLSMFSDQSLQQNMIFLLLGSLIITVPGFAVFLKAFWEYMIITVSLNSMVSDIVKKGFLGYLKAYSRDAKQRTGDYVILLLILTFFWLVIMLFPYASCLLGALISPDLILPVFVLFALVSCISAVLISVNHSLAFQVFSFEAKSPVDIIKKSWQLIKGNFWRTFFMGIILLAVTWWLVPGLFTSLLEKSPLQPYLTYPFEAYAYLFSKNPVFLDILSKVQLTSYGFSLNLMLITAGTIISAMMLPLGSVCFTLLYFDILERRK